MLYGNKDGNSVSMLHSVERAKVRLEVIQEWARQREHANPYLQMPVIGPPPRHQGPTSVQISSTSSMMTSMDGTVESHILMLELGQEQMHNMLQTILQ
jgi:hypothetical protein